MVLLSKGNGEFQGISLVEFICNAVSVVFNHQIGAAVNFHEELHGFRAVRGTGTASLEADLLQQPVAMREGVIYEVFLNLCKAYNVLDRDLCLDIFVEYDIGPRMVRILWFYWEHLLVVAWVGRYYGVQFKGCQGVTQGEPLSPKIFNVVVGCHDPGLGLRW